MSAVAAELVTIEEFEKLPHERMELVRGVVVERPFEGGAHETVCTKVSVDVGQWALGHREFIGMCRAGIVIARNPDTVRGPDVCVCHLPCLPGRRLPEGWLTGPPTMVAEVASGSDNWSETIARLVDYLHFGVDEAWLVVPESRQVHLYLQDDAPTILTTTDSLISTALPGFTTPVAELFRGL